MNTNDPIDSIGAIHPDLLDSLRDGELSDTEITQWLKSHNNQVRRRVAQAEPSDTEVEVAAEAIAACDTIDFKELQTRNHGLAEQYRKQAHAALGAARKEIR